HQSVLSTTGRLLAVRTRRSTLSGVPGGIWNGAATSGGAGSRAARRRTVPGSSPVAAIISETPKFRLRSLRSGGLLDTYVPDPCWLVSTPSASSSAIAPRRELRDTPRLRASSGSLA